jgi:hypothetical protein
MKLILFLVISAVIFFVSSVNATPRSGLRPQGICTSDINSWGHASQCSCSDGEVYDERSGLCLKRDGAEKIMAQGTVSSGMMAIGGETTGFTIKTSDGTSYELILKTADQEKLSKLSGMWFEIEGELITIEGVEIKDRKVIIADRVAVLE